MKTPAPSSPSVSRQYNCCWHTCIFLSHSWLLCARPLSFSSLLWFCFHASCTIISCTSHATASTVSHSPRVHFVLQITSTARLSQLSSLIFSAHTSNEHLEAWYLADRCISYWVYADGITSAFRSSFFTRLGRKTMNNSTSKSPRSLWEKRGTATFTSNLLHVWSVYLQIKLKTYSAGKATFQFPAEKVSF